MATATAASAAVLHASYGDTMQSTIWDATAAADVELTAFILPLDSTRLVFMLLRGSYACSSSDYLGFPPLAVLLLRSRCRIFNAGLYSGLSCRTLPYTVQLVYT